eukprot:GHVN01085011.1.p1 GENE.GHVN01085011.1~~GHVN01085011.1.p1  ORF type:complete len:302 (-),score=58.73 GHVN01085011.1:19-924(-)
MKPILGDSGGSSSWRTVGSSGPRALQEVALSSNQDWSSTRSERGDNDDDEYGGRPVLSNRSSAGGETDQTHNRRYREGSLAPVSGHLSLTNLVASSGLHQVIRADSHQNDVDDSDEAPYHDDLGVGDMIASFESIQSLPCSDLQLIEAVEKPLGPSEGQFPRCGQQLTDNSAQSLTEQKIAWQVTDNTTCTHGEKQGELIITHKTKHGKRISLHAATEVKHHHSGDETDSSEAKGGQSQELLTASCVNETADEAREGDVIEGECDALPTEVKSGDVHPPKGGGDKKGLLRGILDTLTRMSI